MVLDRRWSARAANGALIGADFIQPLAFAGQARFVAGAQVNLLLEDLRFLVREFLSDGDEFPLVRKKASTISGSKCLPLPSR